MAGEEAVELKKPILTSREVGILAAFGGAAFACRAMGIIIPLVPPFVVGPGLLFVVLAAAAGGPIVGALAGVLRAIPAGVPLADIFGVTVMGLVYGLLYAFIVRRMPNRWLRILMIWVTLQIEAWIGYAVEIAACAALGLFPFYPMYPILIQPAMQANFVFHGVVLSVVTTISPAFFRLKG